MDARRLQGFSCLDVDRLGAVMYSAHSLRPTAAGPDEIRGSTPNAKEAEADVIAVRDNLSLTFIECKGHSPYGETPHDEVEKWLQHNVPIFFKSAREHDDWKNLPVHFEFWATAPLTEESIQFLEKAKASIKPTRYTIGWRLGPEVLTICKGTKENGLINAFRKHFMKYNAKSAAIVEAMLSHGVV